MYFLSSGVKGLIFKHSQSIITLGILVKLSNPLLVMIPISFVISTNFIGMPKESMAHEKGLYEKNLLLYQFMFAFWFLSHVISIVQAQYLT